MEPGKVVGVVTGGKVINANGSRYWWADEDAPSDAEPLGADWVEIGYTTEEEWKP